MASRLNPRGWAKGMLLKGLRALEDIASVRPGAQGVVRWIDSSLAGWGAADADPPWTREQAQAGWTEKDPVENPGVFHVPMADVCMFKPRDDGARNTQDRRAAVRVQPFRRIAYPGAPYLLAQRVRGIVSKRYPFPRTGAHLHGRVALLGNEVSDACNYYHFWIDTVGDFLMLREALPPDLQPERFLISYSGQPWQEQILDMIGIMPHQVIPYADYERVTVDELLVPVRDKGTMNMTSGLVDRIRGAAGHPSVGSNPDRLLYISRGDTTRRPVRNEADVQALMHRHGIEVKELSGMVVIEQMALFASARLVVATHGAGLTNLMWCEEGTKVIELLPDRHRVPCFRDICRQRKLEHQVILCPQTPAEDALSASMEVSLQDLEAALMAHGFRVPVPISAAG